MKTRVRFRAVHPQPPASPLLVSYIEQAIRDPLFAAEARLLEYVNKDYKGGGLAELRAAGDELQAPFRDVLERMYPAKTPKEQLERVQEDATLYAAIRKKGEERAGHSRDAAWSPLPEQRHADRVLNGRTDAADPVRRAAMRDVLERYWTRFPGAATRYRLAADEPELYAELQALGLTADVIRRRRPDAGPAQPPEAQAAAAAAPGTAGAGEPLPEATGSAAEPLIAGGAAALPQPQDGPEKPPDARARLPFTGNANWDDD